MSDTAVRPEWIGEIERRGGTIQGVWPTPNGDPCYVIVTGESSPHATPVTNPGEGPVSATSWGHPDGLLYSRPASECTGLPFLPSVQ